MFKQTDQPLKTWLLEGTLGVLLLFAIAACNGKSSISVEENLNRDLGSSPSEPTPTPTPTPQPTPIATPTPTPTPRPTPTPAVGAIELPPTGFISWDWQIGAGSESNIRIPNGAQLMDLDGFDVSKEYVAQLKRQGIYTVCYINAGSWESYRPDSKDYPNYLKLHYDSEWDEWFLDVRDVFRPNSVLAQILRKRIKMCKDKGFQALEPDNLQHDENTDGKITLQEQIDFNGWLADVAHEYGLAIFQKNGPDKVLLKDRTGKMMVEKFDGILNEECQQYRECGPLMEYTKRGKLAVNVEYRKNLTLDCAQFKRLGVSSIKKDLGLVGGNSPGYLLQTCQ